MSIADVQNCASTKIQVRAYKVSAHSISGLEHANHTSNPVHKKGMLCYINPNENLHSCTQIFFTIFVYKHKYKQNYGVKCDIKTM